MRAVALAALLLIVSGCSPTDDTSAATSQPAPARTTAAVASPASRPDGSPLVGTWRRTTTCQERVQALEAAGLGRFAAEQAATEGWIPGVTSVDQLSDPVHPCQGAVPLDHEHFFTASSDFGSRDATGAQVDDGTYTMPDPQTVVIHKEFGDVSFKVELTEDQLRLNPRLPACAREGCFAAQWAVAVSYNGLPWQRAG